MKIYSFFFSPNVFELDIMAVPILLGFFFMEKLWSRQVGI